ncbi:hypothetical protein C8R44DRAFT_864984 [Mycena epipterygia]|nr:hypothetical protein C8R44DRAFT_864984 [Mycena epipterygia]
MSKSSTPSASSNTFIKRRRTYIACLNCRQRKIKCVTPSDADYAPCTRCAQKGVPCQFIAVPEYDSPSSSEILPSDRPSPLQSGRSSRPEIPFANPPIISPSAGLSGLVGGAYPPPVNRNAGYPVSNPPYPQAAFQPDPYRSNSFPGPSTPNDTQRPRHRHRNSAPYPATHSYEAPPGAQQPTSHFYPAAAPQNRSAPPPSPFYHANYGQTFGQTPPAGTAHQSPQSMVPIECICPPGPCYCGAQLVWY